MSRHRLHLQLLAVGLGSLVASGAFAADSGGKAGATSPSGQAQKSKAPATLRLAERWGRKYGLSRDEVEEQARATDESVARTSGPRHEGHEVADSYAFKWKALGVPKGSSRTAVMLRSNQPAPENLVELAVAVGKLGVKPEQVTLINLRAENNVEASYVRDFAASSKDELRSAGGFRTLNLRILDHTIPTQAQVVEVLDILRDPGVKVALLHCKAGRARTGMMVAAARIALDGWTVDEALSEAEDKGLRRVLQVKFIRQFAADWKAGKIKLGGTSKT